MLKHETTEVLCLLLSGRYLRFVLTIFFALWRRARSNSAEVAGAPRVRWTLHSSNRATGCMLLVCTHVWARVFRDSSDRLSFATGTCGERRNSIECAALPPKPVDVGSHPKHMHLICEGDITCSPQLLDRP